MSGLNELANYPVTGPIVACDNAITHYRKLLDELKQQRDRADRDLRNIQGMERGYLDMLDTWSVAKDVLVAAAVQAQQ